MKPAPFDYFAPTSLEEALDLLDRYGPDARVIAGGQSLVPMLALRLARPEVIVDLNRIPALAGIAEEGSTLRIGAMTRQAMALASPVVREKLPLLHLGLENVGHPPTRARGTLGGSISHADPAAETPMIMLAYRATMVIAGSRGERTVDAGQFTLGTFETCLEEGEILKQIIVESRPDEGTGFAELSRRRGDFAMASAAARIRLDDAGKCVEAHLMIGAVAPVPLRCDAVAQALVGEEPSEACIREVVRLIDLDVFEFDNPEISLAYRRHIAPVLARRALMQSVTRARELRK
ncbi:xanthine dehydrogenase family protein subunit M [Mesorhizobium sp. LHD-90]|uniref:FAD binding domain-containing protein n=1 Tax=Mesorhizobium sp. LHD-90 TaxID=3071414 RepID=UPI0027DFF36E|nr:xanthine dehydrogenase family protein subunit M [Mesorhizobium sp. LHD-90]MDQ6432550.1 xanthine dehydrogenase family protein subunit M [Mesorhizobium sp. LHD-90]